jgi:hypothetical protein
MTKPSRAYTFPNLYHACAAGIGDDKTHALKVSVQSGESLGLDKTQFTCSPATVN